MTPPDPARVARLTEILAAPNPTMGKYRAGDWNVWTEKRAATAEMMAMGYRSEAIDAMVGALCETRLDEHRKAREVSP